MILFLQHNFEAGTHLPQSGIAFWITEDDLELLLLLPTPFWNVEIESVLGHAWFYVVLGVESQSPCMLC